MVAPALSFVDLAVSYGDVPVLRGLSLDVAVGSCMGLVGESGCGKSTAALAALRALPPAGRVSAGHVSIAGRDVMALSPASMRGMWAHDVSMVYQNPGAALNPTLRIGAQLAECFSVLGFDDAPALAEAMLARVRIPAPARVMRAYPHQLSGGMQQRVVIAMALAKDPALLVLDEPTTGLDATVEAEILDLVRVLRRETRAAILLISHNLPMVARMCDRIGVLYAGVLVEEGAADAVMRAPRHPYTARLVQCLPGGGQTRHDGALPTIAGQLPAPWVAIGPCVFAPRCDRAEDICGQTPPPVTRAQDHMARCHFSPPFARAAPAADGGGEAPALGAPVLVASHLSKSYATAAGTVRAVSDISFSLAAGETLGVVGESGSGKTTLARMLLGLTSPDAGGSVTLDGHVLAPRLQQRNSAQLRALQIIFQNPDSALNRAHRVRQILARPLARLAGLSGAALEARLGGLAEGVRLSAGHLAMRPRALSGGLKQRVAIARAFAGAPRVVICDEPSSALDVSVQAAILNLLAGLQRAQAVAYLLISHDLAVVRYLADRIAVMYLGRIMEIGPAAAVFAGPHHPYTAALLAAAPGAQGPRLGGETPNAAALPQGCVFHTRCPLKIGAICETSEPKLSGGAHAIRCHIPVAELPVVRKEGLLF